MSDYRLFTLVCNEEHDRSRVICAHQILTQQEFSPKLATESGFLPHESDWQEFLSYCQEVDRQSHWDTPPPSPEDTEERNRWCQHVERMDDLRRSADLQHVCKRRFGG